MQLISQVFGDDAPIALNIARCESTYRQYDDGGAVLRGKVNPEDLGIFQVNAKYHRQEALQLGYDINTLQGNVMFAKHLYDKNGTNDWTASKDCWDVL